MKFGPNQSDLTADIITLVRVAADAHAAMTDTTDLTTLRAAVHTATAAATQAESFGRQSYANGQWQASLARWYAIDAARKLAERERNHTAVRRSEPERIEAFVRSDYFYDAFISGCIARYTGQLCIIALPSYQDARIWIVAEADAWRLENTPDICYLRMPSLYDLYAELPAYPVEDTHLLKEEHFLHKFIDEHILDLQECVRQIYLKSLPASN